MGVRGESGPRSLQRAMQRRLMRVYLLPVLLSGGIFALLFCLAVASSAPHRFAVLFASDVS
jgi:hypothetical protein